MIRSIAAALTLLFCAINPAARVGAQEVTENIVVTATRLPRSPDDIAASVAVIDSAAIARQIADDLDDLVRYQPGISMDTAGRGGNQGFIIRGIGGNRVLTVIDGVRSSDQYAAGPSSYGKDAYEVDDLKSVEIIRGPASVLYGADALGGAVVLRTKSAADYLEDDERIGMNLRIGTSSVDEQSKLGLGVATQIGDADLLAQFTSRQYGEYDANTDVPLNRLDGESTALLLKADLNPAPHHALSIAFDALDETVGLNLLNELDASVTSSVGEDVTERRRLSVAHTWTPDRGPVESLQTQVYRQTSDALQHTAQTRTSYSFVNPMNPASFAGTVARRLTDLEFDQEVSGIALNAATLAGSEGVRHHIVYGVSAETTDTTRPRNRCERELATDATTCAIAAYPFAPPEVFPNRTFPDARTRRGGAYVQDEIVFGRNRRLTVIPGLRYDSYEMDARNVELVDIGGLGYELSHVDESNVSANLGFIFDINDRFAFVAQYAEGFRPPNFDESNQAFVNRAFGYATVPNPELAPEDSRAWELGLRRRFERASVNAAVYRNDYRNFITSTFVGSTSDGISIFQDVNIGRARIEGIEIESRYRFADRWSMHGGLNFSRGRDLIGDTGLDIVDPLTSVLGIGYQGSSARWGVDMNLTAIAAKTEVSADDRVTADAAQLVDVIAHLKIGTDANLRVGVYNLFDEQYARWANLAGLAASDTDAIGRAQGPGTHGRVSFSIEF